LELRAVATVATPASAAKTTMVSSAAIILESIQ
jgi:hypothetical protein